VRNTSGKIKDRTTKNEKPEVDSSVGMIDSELVSLIPLLLIEKRSSE